MVSRSDTPSLLWCKEKTQNPGMKVVLSQINFIPGSCVDDEFTYTSVLPVRDETVEFLAGLLTAERLRRGIRAHPVTVLLLRRMRAFTGHAFMI
ncbi:hypothetical protein [Frankia sp. Cas4]|uniref:hypothetical protein n=1 Tax=Frankia sp. Cas4 TaxID=3073927 RepID=UPI002AD4E393|nr:hypothetical protein [Frankia sp. Cas4]